MSERDAGFGHLWNLITEPSHRVDALLDWAGERGPVAVNDVTRELAREIFLSVLAGLWRVSHGLPPKVGAVDVQEQLWACVDVFRGTVLKHDKLVYLMDGLLDCEAPEYLLPRISHVSRIEVSDLESDAALTDGVQRCLAVWQSSQGEAAKLESFGDLLGAIEARARTLGCEIDLLDDALPTVWARLRERLEAQAESGSQRARDALDDWE